MSTAQYYTLPPLVRSDSDGLCQSPTRLHQSSPESGGVRWDSGGIRWDSGGTPLESSGKRGVGGSWVSLGPKFGPEPKFEPERLRTRSKFSPKFSILLN